MERAKSGHRDFMENPIQEGRFRKNIILHGKTLKIFTLKKKTTTTTTKNKDNLQQTSRPSSDPSVQSSS